MDCVKVTVYRNQSDYLLQKDVSVAYYVLCFSGCELKAGKDITFNPEDDDYDHQLSVRMVRDVTFIYLYTYMHAFKSHT